MWASSFTLGTDSVPQNPLLVMNALGLELIMVKTLILLNVRKSLMARKSKFGLKTPNFGEQNKILIRNRNFC